MLLERNIEWSPAGDLRHALMARPHLPCGVRRFNERPNVHISQTTESLSDKLELETPATQHGLSWSTRRDAANEPSPAPPEMAGLASPAGAVCAHPMLLSPRIEAFEMGSLTRSILAERLIQHRLRACYSMSLALR